LAYVWLPNTGEGGYKISTVTILPKRTKEPSLMSDLSSWDKLPLHHRCSFRNFLVILIIPGTNKAFTAPNAGDLGTKVMIINEMAGSR
jgi:hypothetical protein